jgi:hypothetical protein
MRLACLRVHQAKFRTNDDARYGGQPIGLCFHVSTALIRPAPVGDHHRVPSLVGSYITSPVLVAALSQKADKHHRNPLFAQITPLRAANVARRRQEDAKERGRAALKRQCDGAKSNSPSNRAHLTDQPNTSRDWEPGAAERCQPRRLL